MTKEEILEEFWWDLKDLPSTGDTWDQIEKVILKAYSLGYDSGYDYLKALRDW